MGSLCALIIYANLSIVKIELYILTRAGCALIYVPIMPESKFRLTFRFTPEQHAQYKTNPAYYLAEIRKMLDHKPKAPAKAKGAK